MSKRTFSLLLMLLLLGSLIMQGCSFNKENPDITTDELFQHISYLASDSL
jgi:hypothetical protein